MLTGRPPFTQDNLGDLIVAHMTATAPDVRELNPAVPEGLAQLVSELLQGPGAAPRQHARDRR